MKSKYLLAFSLLGNVALFAVLVFKTPSSAKPLARGAGEAKSPSASSEEAGRDAVDAVRAAEDSAAKLAPALWARIYSSDLPTLVARMRAMGMPPRLMRAIVRSELEAANFERRAALMREKSAVPYWNPKFGAQYEYSMKLAQLVREERDAAALLLGPDAVPSGEELKWNSPVPDRDLPGEKVLAFQRVKSDYDEMRNLVFVGTNGVMLPEAREKLRLIESEYLEDLSAILSPDELKAYQLRSSQTSNQLRSQYSAFDFTEAEFESIYAVQAAFDQKYSSFSFVENSANPERIADQRKMDADIKAALGESRFKEFQRSKDFGYRIVTQVASEYNLPKTTAGAVYELESSGKAELQKILGDRNSTVDQKAQAVSELSSNYSAKLDQLLPGKASASYLNMSGSSLKRMIDSAQRTRRLQSQTPAPAR